MVNKLHSRLYRQTAASALWLTDSKWLYAPERHTSYVYLYTVHAFSQPESSVPPQIWRTFHSHGNVRSMWTQWKPANCRVHSVAVTMTHLHNHLNIGQGQWSWHNTPHSHPLRKKGEVFCIAKGRRVAHWHDKTHWQFRLLVWYKLGVLELKGVALHTDALLMAMKVVKTY